MNYLDIILSGVFGAVVASTGILIGRVVGRRLGHQDARDAMEATFNEALPMAGHFSERLRLILLRMRWQMRLGGLRVPPLEQHEDMLTEKDDPLCPPSTYFRKREES